MMEYKAEVYGKLLDMFETGADGDPLKVSIALNRVKLVASRDVLEAVHAVVSLARDRSLSDATMVPAHDAMVMAMRRDLDPSLVEGLDGFSFSAVR